jgi:hypothetical protein
MGKKEYKITPKIWGPMAWNLLHNIADHFPDELSHKLKEIYINFIYNFEYFLPCDICIRHYRDYINHTKINIRKLNKKYLQEYICNLHNNVNEIKGKKQYSFKECLKVQKRMNHKNFYTYINILLLYYKKKKISITKLNAIKQEFCYLAHIYPNEQRQIKMLEEVQKDSFDEVSDIDELVKWYLHLLKILKFKN